MIWGETHYFRINIHISLANLPVRNGPASSGGWKQNRSFLRCWNRQAKMGSQSFLEKNFKDGGNPELLVHKDPIHNVAVIGRGMGPL